MKTSQLTKEELVEYINQLRFELKRFDSIYDHELKVGDYTLEELNVLARSHQQRLDRYLTPALDNFF